MEFETKEQEAFVSENIRDENGNLALKEGCKVKIIEIINKEK